MTSHSSSRTVLVAGASGGIGRRVAEAFAAAGWTVRRYDRNTDMAKAAEGADVIFNGMNPPGYRNWKVEVPRITRQVIAAAKASGATVLQPGNVYVYGREPGPWTEATPHSGYTRKGHIRVEMERSYRAAAAEGVRTILLRAGDFIDPANPATLFNMLVLRSVAKGVVTATGAPDAPRTYAYLPDLARAFVALAERRDEFAPYEEFGYAGHCFSYRQLADEIARQTGSATRIGAFPWWLILLASPLWETGRELYKMRYLHSMPHRIEGAKFRALLPGWRETGFEALVAASLKRKVEPDQAMSAALAL